MLLAPLTIMGDAIYDLWFEVYLYGHAAIYGLWFEVIHMAMTLFMTSGLRLFMWP